MTNTNNSFIKKTLQLLYFKSNTVLEKRGLWKLFT